MQYIHHTIESNENRFPQVDLAYYQVLTGSDTVVSFIFTIWQHTHWANSYDTRTGHRNAHLLSEKTTQRIKSKSKQINSALVSSIGAIFCFDDRTKNIFSSLMKDERKNTPHGTFERKNFKRLQQRLRCMIHVTIAEVLLLWINVPKYFFQNRPHRPCTDY